VTAPVCVMPVVDDSLDGPGQPRLCREPATTTRKIGSVDVPACDRCAAALDALQADPEAEPPLMPCGMFVTDPNGKAGKCDGAATTTRSIGRITFAMCERCAADFDAGTGGAP
jgi:hypothetical protein